MQSLPQILPPGLESAPETLVIPAPGSARRNRTSTTVRAPQKHQIEHKLCLPSQPPDPITRTLSHSPLNPTPKTWQKPKTWTENIVFEAPRSSLSLQGTDPEHARMRDCKTLQNRTPTKKNLNQTSLRIKCTLQGSEA